QLDEPIGNLPAAVPAFVDDEPFLLPLRHELPHQLVLRVGAGALHVDVADRAAGRLVDELPPLLDPRAIAQLDLAVEARDDDLARAARGRRSVDGQHDRLLPERLEARPRIRFRVERTPVHGEHVLTFLHVHARLVERRPDARVPRPAADDAIDAIRAAGELPVDAEHADRLRRPALEIAAAVIRVRR